MVEVVKDGCWVFFGFQQRLQMRSALWVGVGSEDGVSACAEDEHHV